MSKTMPRINGHGWVLLLVSAILLWLRIKKKKRKEAKGTPTSAGSDRQSHRGGGGRLFTTFPPQTSEKKEGISIKQTSLTTHISDEPSMCLWTELFSLWKWIRMQNVGLATHDCYITPHSAHFIAPSLIPFDLQRAFVNVYISLGSHTHKPKKEEKEKHETKHSIVTTVSERRWRLDTWSQSIV